MLQLYSKMAARERLSQMQVPLYPPPPPAHQQHQTFGNLQQQQQVAAASRGQLGTTAGSTAVTSGRQLPQQPQRGEGGVDVHQLFQVRCHGHFQLHSTAR